MDPIKSVNSLLNTVGKLVDYVKTSFTSHVTDNSMMGLTKLTNVEPLTVISQDCINLPYLEPLMNNLCSVYAAQYIQAVAIMTQAAVNIEVIRTLDALNPNRDETGFLLQGRHAMESRQTTYAVESFASSYKFSLPTKDHKTNMRVNAVESFDRDNTKTLYETSNLAVGKLINVNFQVGNQQGSFTDETVPSDECARMITLPINVRLSPVLLDPESIGYIFTHRKEDRSMVERYYQWRAGRIRLIQDAVFCSDLITEYRRAALKDRTGTLQEIVRRVNANRGYGLLTKNPSMAISSNIYVLTEESAREIEGKVGHKFSDPRGREKILEGTYAMIIAVIDPDRELVHMYFNGLAEKATLTVRAIKAATNNKNMDLTDVMNSLLNGRAPTF